ncbi:MAG TPA: hypothetical protein VH414_17725 [Lichenihabitans sp.]|nr:hypothetical protein [Lichenihabitans sp.]
MSVSLSNLNSAAAASQLAQRRPAAGQDEPDGSSDALTTSPASATAAIDPSSLAQATSAFLAALTQLSTSQPASGADDATTQAGEAATAVAASAGASPSATDSVTTPSVSGDVAMSMTDLIQALQQAAGTTTSTPQPGSLAGTDPAGTVAKPHHHGGHHHQADAGPQNSAEASPSDDTGTTTPAPPGTISSNSLLAALDSYSSQSAAATDTSLDPLLI